MIPDEIIRDVIDAVDIVDLVGRAVDLRKAGTIYKGLCPFHGEKTPSFIVTPERRSYHCFGCGMHGNAIDFLMEHERLSFPEAVRALAHMVGVEVPEPRPETPQQRQARAEKKDEARRLLDAQAALTDYYAQQLFGVEEGLAARRYLIERGVSEEAARAFRLGWAGGDKAAFEAWMRRAAIDREDLVKLGVLLKPDEGWGGAVLGGGYLRFRSRLMFPVIDINGEVVGFSGRLIEAGKKAAKYINSPETPIFTKGEHLYGAHTARGAARRAGRLIFCEGNLDVVALWQAGFEGSVAAMGTALTQKQARLCKRLSEDVLCLMDGDSAGRKALFESLLTFLDEGIHPRGLLLPEGEDPDSYIKRGGVTALQQALRGATPLFDLFIDKVVEETPPDPMGRAEAARRLIPPFSRLDDPLTQALYREQICARLQISPQAFDLAASRGAPLSPAPPPRPSTGDPAPPSWDEGDRNQSAAPISVAEGKVVEFVLQFPHMLTRVGRDFWRENLTHEGLIRFLAGLYSEIERGQPPNIDRRLTDLGGSALASQLWEWRARLPSQDEETIQDAFDQAIGNLQRRRFERTREDLLRALSVAFAARAHDRCHALQAELQDIQKRLTALKPSK
ncbi:DNA primase [Myxococcota bacterium]|nr:DNA primase [Myxococcota bacterium]MBU1899947.1 DNA primase [Myxococcota bacterium]